MGISQLQNCKQDCRADSCGCRGGDGKHDHDLVLCGHHWAAPPEDLASEHARDRYQAGDAEHVDDGRQRRPQHLAQHRPACARVTLFNYSPLFNYSKSAPTIGTNAQEPTHVQ